MSLGKFVFWDCPSNDLKWMLIVKKTRQSKTKATLDIPFFSLRFLDIKMQTFSNNKYKGEANLQFYCNVSLIGN